jgi:hypothetical protein
MRYYFQGNARVHSRAGQGGEVLRGIRSRTWRAESRAEEGRIKERRGQRRAQSAISLFV